MTLLRYSHANRCLGGPRSMSVEPDDDYARIHEVVARIPAGRVATYGQVAALAGLPGRARQVGHAMRALPGGSAIPWQRVLNARGEVSPRPGAAWAAARQRHLLEEEGVRFDARGRIDLERFRWEPETAPGPKRPAGPTIADWTRELERTLRARGSPARAAGAKRYLKSDLDFLGVDADGLRTTAGEFLTAHPGLGRAELLRLVDALWRTRLFELRSVGVALLERRPEALRAADLPRLERLLRRAGTWAHVDWIAVHLVGPLVEAHPELAARLDRWVEDPDFWLRRSALLALLLPLRRGAGDWRRFVRYADAMLDEREFFIRKAIGWVLRETAKRRPERVRAYLATRLDRLAGLTLREASKPLPAAARRRLLAAHGRSR